MDGLREIKRKPTWRSRKFRETPNQLEGHWDGLTRFVKLRRFATCFGVGHNLAMAPVKGNQKEGCFHSSWQLAQPAFLAIFFLTCCVSTSLYSEILHEPQKGFPDPPGWGLSKGLASKSGGLLAEGSGPCNQMTSFAWQPSQRSKVNWADFTFAGLAWRFGQSEGEPSSLTPHK